jgi:hypothetical protein
VTALDDSMTEHGIDQEVAELRAAVLAMREELDRRDVEQAEMEGVLEFILERESAVLSVLGRTVSQTFGDRDDEYGGALMLDLLYSGPRHKAGFRQGTFARWRRPERRWRQYGSRADLVRLAEEAGAAVKRRDTREGLVRKLWAADALPGGIGPHTRQY